MIQALEAQLAAADTPETRLATWRVMQGLKVSARSSMEREDETPRRGIGGPALRALEARNRNRTVISDSTNDELDVEMARAFEGGVTTEEVDALILRKEMESRIELQYGVNITTDLTESAPTQWGTDELSEIEGTFARIPRNDLPHVGTVRKATGDQYPDGTAGVHLGDSVSLFEKAKYKGNRISSQESDLADNHARSAGGRARLPAVSRIEEDLAHEIGHEAAEHHGAAYRHFTEAAGWRQLHGDQLDDNGLDAAEIGRVTKDAARPGEVESVEHGGDVFRRQLNARWNKDGSPVYVARHAGAIPEGAGWDYAAASPDEHFAEVYTKAINAPETLHHDLVELPQRLYEDAQKEFLAAHQAMLGGLMLGEGETTALAAKTKAAGEKLARAKQAAESRSQQWQIMRQEVFGMSDKRVDQEAKRLAARGLGEDQLDEFRTQAAKAMTEDQLTRLSGRMSPQ